MSLAQLRNRVRAAARRHVLDVLDERGLVRGTRLVFPQPGVCSLEGFEEAGPGPGEILVETLLSLISTGTERAIYLHLPNVDEPYPHVPGYSQVGRVVAAGAGAVLQPGELVASAGAHASLHLCPEDRAWRLPPGVPLDSAVFTQIACVALQAVRKARIAPAERVLVLGAGLVGQLSAVLAQTAGGDVTLAATSRDRLGIAADAGLSQCVDLSQGRQALDGFAASVVLDATGNPQAINDALLGAAKSARIVLVGSPRGATQRLDLGLIEAKGLRILGAHTHTLPSREPSGEAWTWSRECAAFLDLLADQRLKVQPLITRRASPAEAPSVYASLARKDDKSVGVLFDWTQPGPWRARVDTVSPLRLAAAGLRRVLQRAPARGPATLATRKDGRKLRFGLIGCGEIAADSATAIRAAPNATITHAVDTSPERARSLAAATGAKATTELRELLDSPNVDAVLISTPHNLHAPLAIQAAQHGKHVVVEKPMAITVADCDRMIAAAASHRVLLSVCYCSRFEPAVSEARRLIEAGAVGRVFGTRISFGQWRGREYWTEGLTGRTRGDWRRHRETAGGGVLIMNACHLLDYMTWLVGSPISDVSATLATLASDVEVEDTVSLSYRYQSGAVGSLDATTALVGPWVFSQEIWGRDGRLQLAPQLRFWSSRVIDGRDRQTWHTVRLSPSDSRARYFEAFANAVLDDGAPPVTGAEARAVQAAIEAAYSSVETRRTVAVVG